jgi:hypothetical protein
MTKVKPGGSTGIMDKDRGGSVMDRDIFKLGLSVEAVSLYILCCTLADQGRPVSIKNILPTWNSTEEELKAALKELSERGILRQVLSDLAGNEVYRILDSGEWNARG